MNAKTKVKVLDQEQLLKFENELSQEEKEALYAQIEKLDFSYLEELNKPKTKKEDVVITPLEPLRVEEREKKKAKLEEIGLKALRKMEVGILLLAGGMGTRLGSDAPKGMYNIGKTRDVYIFQRLFENALDVVKMAGNFIPFFIMTSEKNNEATINFLEEKNYFGYDKNFVKFFVQDMAPCVDLNGKVLLEEKGRVATSPNGNGGWFNSLLNNKEAKSMLEYYNIKWLNIFSVDNVLQRVAEPAYIGAVLDGNYQVGVKVVKKVAPTEKVGHICYKNGRPSFVEYIEISEEMINERNKNGELVYNYGNVLNDLFSIDLLYRIKDEKLPIHVVKKKVDCVDEKGNTIKPQEPNAYKFEMLNVDMIDLADSCLVYEVLRETDFAPIKNKEGADSVAVAQVLLEKNGYVL